MIVILLTTSVIVVAIGIAFKIRSSRQIDVLSFVLNVMLKTRLLNLLSKLGLTNRLRPKTVTKITLNNVEFTTAAAFLCNAIFQYVLKFRTFDSDVFVVTYPKAGTTWVQEIAWLICNNADINAAVKTHLTRRSPFLETVDTGDNLGMQTLEKWPTDSIRVIKTHQPYDLLPTEVCVENKGKIIYVARNPKDLCVSYFHFHHMVFGLPPTGPWEEFLTAFSIGNVPWGDWFTHTLKYWKEFNKNPDQIYFTTYESLKTDLGKEVKSIARFLGKTLTDAQIHLITEHCTFDSMSKNKSTNYENIAKDGAFDYSETKFMRKGEVGDWKNYFTINQSEAFDRLYRERMKDSGLDLQFDL